MSVQRRVLALAIAIVLAGGCRQRLGPEPQNNERAEKAWNETLGRVVTDDGYVDYDLLEQERATLDAYLAWIAHEDSPGNRGKVSNVRHAYWINAYNALVLYQVLERGRPDSVMDVQGWIPARGSGFFVETTFQVGGDWLSLYEIEHERLRMRQMDIRDHAALNCASRSCPPLRRGLFRKKKISKDLHEQMKVWVNDPERGVSIDPTTGHARFSAIFDMYARDFEFWTAEDNLCRVTANYAEGSLREELNTLAEEGCPHSFATYDWSLNDASR